MDIKKSELGSTYSINGTAKNAVDTLTNAVNALQLYNPNNVLSYNNAFLDNMAANGYTYKQSDIKALMDAATNAAYDKQYAELQQATNAAEDQQVSNTRSAIQDMRKALAGSASSGGNVGAANATALQGLLGLGQTNSSLATSALQNVQNTAREKSAALAQNAVDALTTSNDAINSVLSQANTSYGADQAAGGERGAYAAEGLGTEAAAIDTNASNERQNSATNRTNKSVAQTTTKSKQTVINK